jgi:alkylhydroperoxidase family enzyme
MLPLLSIDESAQLGEKFGIERYLATANVFRTLFHSPSAAAGVYGVVNALMFHNTVAARARELIILRIGWRTGSEYVFCNHVRISRDLGIPDREILGVRDPKRCTAYSATDHALLHLADELHESAEVTRATWSALEKAFAHGEMVELLLIAGFWRMVAGFVKSTRIQLDDGVPSWPEGKEPERSSPQ